MTLAPKQLSVQGNILKARPLLGPCLGTTKIRTDDRRSYGKDGLPGSGMVVETPPLFQGGWVTLCPSHRWEQVCNKMNWGLLPPVGTPWTGWPKTHDIPRACQGWYPIFTTRTSHEWVTWRPRFLPSSRPLLNAGCRPWAVASRKAGSQGAFITFLIAVRKFLVDISQGRKDIS